MFLNSKFLYIFSPALDKGATPFSLTLITIRGYIIMIYRIYGYNDTWQYIKSVTDKDVAFELIDFYLVDYDSIIIVEHNILEDSDFPIYDSTIDRSDRLARKRKKPLP